MFKRTKPGSEEFDDVVRHLKKLEHIENSQGQPEIAPFNIELVDMDRFKPPNSVSHEFESEGSYPNECLDNVGRSKKEAGRRSS